MQIVMLVAVAYLFGSFPSGKVYGLYFKGIDIQQHGSKNIGFANACRVLGYKLGVLVLVSDVLKGFLPLLIAQTWFSASTTTLMAMGIATILGHAYPVWLSFKGGKSIATGLGVLLVISPIIALLAIATYISTFLITRVSGTSSLLGAWSLIVWAFLFDTQLALYCIALALFATYTHRNNLRQQFLRYVS